MILCPIAQRRADASEEKDGFQCLLTASDFIPCSRQLDCFECQGLWGQEIIWPLSCNHEDLGTLDEAAEARMSWEDRYELAVMLNLCRVPKKRRIWDISELQKQAILDYEEGLAIDYSSIVRESGN